jgi:hypothetical protein
VKATQARGAWMDEESVLSARKVSPDAPLLHAGSYAAIRVINVIANARRGGVASEHGRVNAARTVDDRG